MPVLQLSVSLSHLTCPITVSYAVNANLVKRIIQLLRNSQVDIWLLSFCEVRRLPEKIN